MKIAGPCVFKTKPASTTVKAIRIKDSVLAADQMKKTGFLKLAMVLNLKLRVRPATDVTSFTKEPCRIRPDDKSKKNRNMLIEFRDKCNRHSQWGSGVDSPGLYTIACCPEMQRGSCTA